MQGREGREEKWRDGARRAREERLKKRLTLIHKAEPKLKKKKNEQRACRVDTPIFKSEL